VILAGYMFGTEMDGKEMQGYKDRFNSLGLGQLLDPDHLLQLQLFDIADATAAALGVDRADAASMDPRESEAWFLANFAWYYFALRDREARTEVERRSLHSLQINYAIEFGRLIEWWRWRSKGHDAEAVAKQTQNDALSEAQRQANNDRADAADEWHEQALALAQGIWERRPHLSKSRVAVLVKKKLEDDDPGFDKALRTIREVISDKELARPERPRQTTRLSYN